LTPPCHRETELFLDDEFLAMTASVTRKIHQPTKHRLNPSCGRTSGGR